MSGESSLASLVILTDSVRVLQEHVNTGNVFKTPNSEQISICPSISEKTKLLADPNNSNSNELAELSPADNVSGNHESDELVKLPTDECSFSDSESKGINDEIPKNERIFSSSDTKSEMKLRSCGESDSIGNFIDKQVPFQNKQEIDCNEDSYTSFRSNETMPMKTYSRRKTNESDKQFDGLSILPNEESITDLSILNERKRHVTKGNLSNSQNSNSETKLCSSVKKPRRSKSKKPKKKCNGKENSKLLRKISGGTVVQEDLDNKSKTECKIPNQKRLRTRKCRNISKNKPNSTLKQSKLEVFKCVTCGKLIRKIITISKYSFRSSNNAKSRRCQKCQNRKNGVK